MRRTWGVLPMLAWCAALGHSAPAAEPATMDNGFFRLSAGNGTVTSLQVDPTGKGRYGRNWLVEMRFEGLSVTPETSVVRTKQALRTRGLAAETPELIEVGNGGVADALAPDHTLGQSFQVKAGNVTRLEVCLPTWATTDSSATLALRRGGPGGEVIAQRRLANVVDNSWQELTFEPQGEGTYYVELSEPEGHIGWWSSRERKYPDGEAYADGQPVAGAERALKVHGGRSVGQAEVSLGLDGPKLSVTALVTPAAAEQPRQWPLAMTFEWDNEGYDVSAKSVPFLRFFTDNMRYMPVEQLKRWRERDGWYELNFAGCQWIEADGTGDHDLRFSGRGLGLSWHLGSKQTTMRFTTSPTGSGEAFANAVTLQALRREDALPADWPRFVLPDRDEAKRANQFFYERAFTYPPVWGPAAWFAWNPLTRSWQGGEHLDQLGRDLEDYPITDEGYVHTWGAGLGWPFPDNARYDTRHFDTNARFILGCWQHAAWTGDVGFLRQQAERLRKAMEYQLTVLNGREGLIVTASKDVTGRHMGVGDNYWDILPFGHLDAYANALWYASIEAMAQIEEMLRAMEAPATQAPAHPPELYRELAVRAKRAYNDTFWDEEKGRYIGCIDVDGGKHDYGFTFVNVEAMAYGLADEAKARRIYAWMETEPTSTGKADTYGQWMFAPRANTLHDPRWNPQQGKLDDVPQDPWWFFGWHGTAYGDQCQDGGAILYTSFYDLMARCRYLGPDNAWRRWEEILARWEMPDHLCGGPPLYRGEQPQQINPGAVGVDIPFPESGMVPCWLLYGALGAQPTSEGLEVAPRLPESLPWVEVRNVAYRNLPLTIRGTRAEVVISCDAPGCKFRWRRALGSAGRVLFKEPPAPVRFPEQPLWRKVSAWRAEWIWLADGEAPRAFFRDAFDLPASAKRAWLSITADNAFVLYVNGQRVTSGADWSVLYRADLARYLRKGRNVIAVAADNSGGPGGLVAQGEVKLADGGTRQILTGRDWRVSPSEDPDWLQPDFDDSGWAAAHEYGRPPCAPWLDIGDPEAVR